MTKYIDVVLNVPLNQAFTYRIPEDSDSQITVSDGEDYFGRRVEVRFGNRNLTGFITGCYENLPESCAVSEDKIRPAKRFLDQEALLTHELYDLAKWMTDYYLSNIGETVFTMMNFGKRESEYSVFSSDDDFIAEKEKELSDEQKAASEGILDVSQGYFHYLYGMTGSGKTEVFLTAANKVLNQGKGIIYLVPEIGLTPQVQESVTHRFGNTVAVLHSQLTPSQKLKQWHRILNKEARIVIGARSAIFAPVPDLGLIIIDEEHDSSYKAGNAPRYHARQVAMKRASTLKIPLVMGSATPSVEAWASIEKKAIQVHTLTKRLAGGAMPLIKTIDLSSHSKSGSCLSKELENEIRHTLQENRQTILFLNRRGFTHFFRCNSCGYEMKCKNCSVSMTYHKAEKRLRCHYCGFSLEPPKVCPKCQSLDVGYSGFGTEFIEAEVKAKFPAARIIRVDTDALNHKGELEEKLTAFKNGEYDILLGTQMVAKGLNFPNLKLVGVVLADTSLHLPDFRAAEKTFSLITQVAGRAGRFFPDGKVLVQTYSPESEPILYAVKGETEEFYKNELETRKMLSFPPYTRLLRLVFRSQIPKAAYVASQGAKGILKMNCCPDVQILGPAECPLEMVNNNHRWQIILRGKEIRSLQKMAAAFVRGYKAPKDVYIEVDVDPVNML
jgi:primosomal protein N' (replication factor Y)